MAHDDHLERSRQSSRQSVITDAEQLDDPFVENHAIENPLNPRIRHEGPTFINLERRKSSASRHPSAADNADDKLETVVERGEMSPETIRPAQCESIRVDTPTLAKRLEEKVDPALDGYESPTKTQSHADTSISSKSKVPRLSSIANLKNHLFRSSRGEKDTTQSTKSGGNSDLDDMMNDLSSLKANARTESVRTGTLSAMLTESSGYAATGTDGSQDTGPDIFGGDGAVPRRGSKNRKRAHKLNDTSSKEWSQHSPERKSSLRGKRGVSPRKEQEPWKRAPVMVDFTTNAELVDDTLSTFMTSLTYAISTYYSIPETSICLTVRPSVQMMLAGTFGAAYQLTITGINELFEKANNENKVASALLSHDIWLSLRIPAARGIIKYQAISGDSVFYDGFSASPAHKHRIAEKDSGVNIFEDPMPAATPYEKSKSLGHGVKRTALRGVRSISNFSRITGRNHREKDAIKLGRSDEPLVEDKENGFNFDFDGERERQRRLARELDDKDRSEEEVIGFGRYSTSFEKGEEAGYTTDRDLIKGKESGVRSKKESAKATEKAREMELQREIERVQERERVRVLEEHLEKGKERQGRMRRIKSMGMGLLRQG